MHPLALAVSGWVWVGAGSRPAGLRTGRAIPGLRRDAALPVRQNTRQGREGGALPKPLINQTLIENDLRQAAPHRYDQNIGTADCTTYCAVVGYR
jgi:hypothetical protein